jgi:hypothetical protein
MHRQRLIPLILVVAVGLAACQAGDDPTATPDPTELVAESPTASPTPTAPVALRPEQVFSLVSPAIAFVDTPLGTGSGMLVDREWLITNAHVVWPFDAVRIVFADGTEYIDAPVEAWDLLADLAVVRLPGDLDVEPVRFVDPSGMPTGSELFLIGYPAESEEFPQPTISSGVLSRFRDWPTAGFTYVQTDASIAGGQSGGALVTNTGEVVGLSGFKFADAFGLALAAPIVEERGGALIEGTDRDSFNDRRLPATAGDVRLDFSLANYYDQRAFVVRQPAGTVVDVSVDSINDAVIDVTDPYGAAIGSADEYASGVETLAFTVDIGVPFIVLASQLTVDPGDFQITSNVGLAAVGDPDDGRLLRVGQTYLANIDYPGDLDMFEIDLIEGQAVRFTVESLNIDPDLVIDTSDNLDDELAYDDDSGGGLFGTDARIDFTPPSTGRYVLSVADVLATQNGGYFITIE